jgi:hypothetical protein
VRFYAVAILREGNGVFYWFLARIPEREIDFSSPLAKAAAY